MRISDWSSDVCSSDLTAWNSMDTGPGTSVATTPIVSEMGRPDRRPRTISSIASGNRAVNLATRRLMSLPITKCGRTMPTKRQTKIERKIGAPPHVTRVHVGLGSAHEDYRRTEKKAVGNRK